MVSGIVGESNIFTQISALKDEPSDADHWTVDKSGGFSQNTRWRVQSHQGLEKVFNQITANLDAYVTGDGEASDKIKVLERVKDKLASKTGRYTRRWFRHMFHRGSISTRHKEVDQALEGAIRRLRQGANSQDNRSTEINEDHKEADDESSASDQKSDLTSSSSFSSQSTQESVETSTASAKDADDDLLDQSKSSQLVEITAKISGRENLQKLEKEFVSFMSNLDTDELSMDLDEFRKVLFQALVFCKKFDAKAGRAGGAKARPVAGKLLQAFTLTGGVRRGGHLAQLVEDVKKEEGLARYIKSITTFKPLQL